MNAKSRLDHFKNKSIKTEISKRTKTIKTLFLKNVRARENTHILKLFKNSHGRKQLYIRNTWHIHQRRVQYKRRFDALQINTMLLWNINGLYDLNDSYKTIFNSNPLPVLHGDWHTNKEKFMTYLVEHIPDPNPSHSISHVTQQPSGKLDYKTPGVQ